MTKVLTYLLVITIAITTPIEFARIQTVQAHQNDALHTIICFSESYVSASKKTPPAKKRQFIHVYSEMLARAHLAPCDNGG